MPKRFREFTHATQQSRHCCVHYATSLNKPSAATEYLTFRPPWHHGTSILNQRTLNTRQQTMTGARKQANRLPDGETPEPEPNRSPSCMAVTSWTGHLRALRPCPTLVTHARSVDHEFELSYTIYFFSHGMTVTYVLPSVRYTQPHRCNRASLQLRAEAHACARW